MMIIIITISFNFFVDVGCWDFDLWGFLDVSTTQPNRELLAFM